jgi:FkbM family methyltransferase
MLYSLMKRVSARKDGLSRWLMERATLYADLYRDFSYDPDVNGESRLLGSLAAHRIRTVFDVGANVGDWALQAGNLFPEARIHCFELSESTRNTLRDRCIGRNIQIADVALGARAGSIEYKDYGSGSLVNTMVATKFHDTQQSHQKKVAQITTGDAYMAAHGIAQIDLLKVDVEGAEMQVLRGFEKALTQGQIRVIQFEYGHANGDAGSGNLMRDFYDLLEAASYSVGRLWSAGIQFRPFGPELNNFDSGPNYIAILRRETELIRILKSPV